MAWMPDSLAIVAVQAERVRKLAIVVQSLATSLTCPSGQTAEAQALYGAALQHTSNLAQRQTFRHGTTTTNNKTNSRGQLAGRRRNDK